MTDQQDMNHHDVFMSFASEDEARVKILVQALRSQGISVFWSVDIPVGAPNYQSIIATQIAACAVVVVAWTRAAVKSHAIAQECAQAVRERKLLQTVLEDEIQPIAYPMEAQYLAEKAMLVNWNGDRRHKEWLLLLEAVTSRIDDVTRESSVQRDDLTRIRGISARLVAQLEALGVREYRTIANWTPDEIDQFAAKLDLRGVMERQNWVGQARQLADGGETRFSRRGRSA